MKSYDHQRIKSCRIKVHYSHHHQNTNHVQFHLFPNLYEFLLSNDDDVQLCQILLFQVELERVGSGKVHGWIPADVMLLFPL